MARALKNGSGKRDGRAIQTWVRRVMFLIIIPVAYLYAFRTIYIEYLVPNFYSIYVDEIIDLEVLGFLLLYILIYPFLLLVPERFALHARVVLVVLLVTVPTAVVIANFPEDTRIPKGSRYWTDRVDPNSGSRVTWVIVDSQLVGAKNVVVDGRTYDVEFVEGSCLALFDGCDDPREDFAFRDAETAKRAAQALLDQVFLDGVIDKDVIYNFDSLPTQVFGCVWTNVCGVTIPYGRDTTDQPLLFSSANNAAPGAPDTVHLGSTYEVVVDSSARYLWNYAKFTPSP